MTHALPLDNEMPQVATLWDGQAMGRALEKAWSKAGSPDITVLNCRLERFRYRSGLRSIVLYEVSVRKSATEKPSSFWVTATTYTDNRAKRIYKRLKLLDPGGSQPTAVAYLESLRTVVQLFPLDRYMPHLPRVLGNRDEPLRELLLRESGLDVESLAEFAYQPVRYRPQIACTMRIDVPLNGGYGVSKQRNFYLKMYRDGESTGAFTQLNSYADLIERYRCPFGVVAPLAHLPHLGSIVFPAAQGDSVETSMLYKRSVHHAMTKSADALASLHLSDLSVDRRRGVEDVLLRARKAEKFITWGQPALREQLNRIILMLGRRMDESLMRPAHQDIKPEHLFVDGGKVWFIDMDSTALGDPVFDVATMLARLHAMPYLSTVERGTVEQAANIFLTRYFGRVPDEWSVRLGLNLACAFLKVSLFFVQHLSENWRERVCEFVQLADDSLNGVLPRIACAMD